MSRADLISEVLYGKPGVGYAMTVEEIADIEGVSHQYITQTIHNALLKLRRKGGSKLRRMFEMSEQQVNARVGKGER